MPSPYSNNSIYNDDRAGSSGGREIDEASYGPAASPRSVHDQLEQALDVLYRRKWIVVCVLLLSVLAAGGYAYTRQPYFEATSYIIVDLAPSAPRQQSDEGGLESSNLFASSNRSISEELLLLQVSSPIPRRVALRLQDMKVTPQSEEPIQLLSTGSGTPLPTEHVAARVSGMVDLNPAGGKVVRVKAKGLIPEEAALVANLFAEEYEKLTQEASRAHFSSSWDYLQEQEQKWSAELRDVERRIESYKGDHGAAGLSQESSYLVTRLADLEAQRDEARIQLQMARESLQSYEERLNEATPELAARVANDVDAQIQAVRSEISTLETSREDIQQRYPPSQRTQAVRDKLQHIDEQIQQHQSRLEELSKQYIEDGMSMGAGGENGLSHFVSLRQKAAEERQRIRELETRMNLLDSRVETMREKLQSIPQQSMQLAQLERSRVYAERMYQTITGRMLEARLDGETGQSGGYVRVLRQAGVPGVPVQQNIPRIMMLGVFFGALLGGGLAIGRDKLDNRIYKPDQLREKGQRVLGVVPNMDGLLTAKYDKGSRLRKEGEHVASSLVALFDPLSPAAEAYRHLRTSIQFGPSHPIQTLLITSPSMGDGKSLTAANLAVSMAQGGARTLLVDADLRRPRLSSLLGLPGEPSLMQLLTAPEENLERIPQTGVDGLWAVPAGSPQRNSAELLGSVHMEELLGRLRGQFDMIIIDTPPMLATTDAAQLASRCDATLLVARSGRTREKEFEDSVARLEEVGAEDVGILLNDFDLSKAYGYAYRYSTYYGYGDDQGYGDGSPGHTNNIIRKITA